MRDWLAAQDGAASLILTSPAVRARATAAVVRDAFDVDPRDVIDVDELYLAGPEDVLDAVRAVPEPTVECCLQQCML